MDHRHLTKALKFDSQIQSAAEGLVGGIIIMWKEDQLKLDNISVTSQGIHVLVKVIPNSQPWLFSMIYASSDINTPNNLWHHLQDFSHSYNLDWRMGEDFNKVLYTTEKLGGNNISHNRSKHFGIVFKTVTW